MIREIWKPIKDFEGLYEVSSLGRVASLPRLKKYKNSGGFAKVDGRILTIRKQRDGYWLAYLSKESKQYYRYVHRLVAEAFLGPVPEELTVNHKDGDKNNNIPNNLEYCTMKENNAHAGRINLKPAGIYHHNSVLTKENQSFILKKFDQGWTHKKIALQLKVSRSTVSYFLAGKTYMKDVKP